MPTRKSSLLGLRRRFDEIYDALVIGGGFFESDEYYRWERNRYWKSLQYFLDLDIPRPAKILEVGGGQMALLCKSLFGDDCIVADISRRYAAPLQRSDIKLVTYNLVEQNARETFEGEQFDLIVMLEIVEHIPLPAHAIVEHIKPLLKPAGLLFITTPNLFRVRNMIRMILGVEFLDRFMTAAAGQSLGHQLEYSADHLRWQLERAGMEIVILQHDSLGRIGHSLAVRVARWLSASLELRPIWRDGIVAVARTNDQDDKTRRALRSQ